MGLCKRWEKTVWHIDKNAQIEMGFVRKKKTIALWFGKKSVDKLKKVHNISYCILKQTVRKEAILGVSANFSI